MVPFSLLSPSIVLKLPTATTAGHTIAGRRMAGSACGSMHTSIESIISRYKLEPHPEGGYYRRVYQSNLSLPQSALTSEHQGDRYASTAIIFMLTRTSISRLHVIASDEMWHFYDGDPVAVIEFWKRPSGDQELQSYQISVLGRPSLGLACTHVVPAGRWFGCCPLSALLPDLAGDATEWAKAHQQGYSLVGCTVSPGFDFDDFKLLSRSEAIKRFEHARHASDEASTAPGAAGGGATTGTASGVEDEDEPQEGRNRGEAQGPKSEVGLPRDKGPTLKPKPGAGESGGTSDGVVSASGEWRADALQRRLLGLDATTLLVMLTDSVDGVREEGKEK